MTANEVKHLLDAGAIVVLRKNALGSYLALSVSTDAAAYDAVTDVVDHAMGYDPATEDYPDQVAGVVETDHFTPVGALAALAEKAIAGATS